jgi:hypothetical protein
VSGNIHRITKCATTSICPAGVETDLDVDELRARLARMSDRALLEFGRAADMGSAGKETKGKRHAARTNISTADPMPLISPTRKWDAMAPTK